MSDSSTVEKLPNLVVPSDASKVTVENLWRTMNAITKIGRVFQKKDIASHPDSPFTGQIDIGRILSYLKYLGIISESREKIKDKEGKVQRIQKYKVTEKAQKFYYLIQSGRKEEAMAEWSNLIKDHDLYKIVAEELLSQTKKTTIRELQDIIWEAYGGKHQSSFYRNGAEFVAELLDNAELVEFDKSTGLISLKEYTAEKKLVTPTIAHPIKVAGPPIGPDFMEFSYEGLYLKIKPDQTRIELAKGVLSLIEKQLQAKKKKTVNEEHSVGKAEVDKTS